MKKIALIVMLVSSQKIFAQKGDHLNYDTNRIFINFKSDKIKPRLGTVYVTGPMQNIFSSTMYIPNNNFLWLRCGPSGPCVISIDATNPELLKFEIKEKIYRGDSILIDLDTHKTSILNRKTSTN